jgi:outer membrane receptor protein involved in Fe transport
MGAAPTFSRFARKLLKGGIDMTKVGHRRRSHYLKLFGSVSVSVLIAVGISDPAIAQDAARSDALVTPPVAAKPAASENRAVEAEDIVVTGTRVVRDGYKAPTPTSVISAQEIATKAPANVADFVNELPALSGSTTPRSTTSFVSSGLIGINALNLRNLGGSRTLVLLDGQRVGGSSLTGLVDVNQFPQALVKRVDVVTGGASAGYGSDAVAGVVNFILDKDFTGLKGQVQGGVTNYGDNRNFNVSLAAGARFADDRGHILLSGEIAHEDGVKGIGNRTWYNGAKILFNPAYTATNGQPQLLVRNNVGFATATPGGLITSGPLQGTYFGPGGTPTQFNYGSIVSGNYIVGGDWRYADYATSGDLSPELSRQNIFGRVSYDLTEHVQVYAQGSYGRSTASNAITSQFNLANITIQPDNAFIPTSIAGRVTAPFTLGTLNQDLGPLFGYSRRTAVRAVLGAKGDFGALGSNWTWDIYGQRSINRVYSTALLSITANYKAAIDSVRNANGTIVCRSTLTNPNNGCVPYDIFGTGVVSDAARNYVLGTAFGKTKLTEDVVAGTLRGEPLSTWAGPVSIATGFEHRREAVSGSVDALDAAAQALSVSTGAARVAPYFAGNYLPSFGSYQVTEGFFETVVPLAKDLPFAHSLDFNGAVRVTDYSTSGVVATWKAGLTYSPIEDITFRFTRSRDIRAPNLAENFAAGTAGTTTIADPFRANASTTFTTTTTGNLNLRPEKADSLGFGVVVQPRFLPGFAASVDYYDIRVADAIVTPAPADIVNQCFAGNAAFCSQITRNGAGVITAVTAFPINLAKQIARGLDFEASYRRPFLSGNLGVRVLATRFLKNYQNNGINVPTDNVGQNAALAASATASGAGALSLPKWRYFATVSWDRDPVMLSLTARGFSAGVFNTSYVQCTSGCPVSTVSNMTIENNHVPGALYFDTNVTVKLPHDVEAFVVVENIANKDPVQVAIGPNLGSAPLPINSSLYDTLGRTFRVGVRFKM